MNKVLMDMSAGISLAFRNISIQTKEHALGYTWALLTPVLYAICYIFVKRELSGSAENGSELDIFRAFTGIMLFQCWMQIVQDMTELVRRNKGMLRGLGVGPEPLVFAVIIEGFVGVVIRASLIVASIPILSIDMVTNSLSWLLIAISILTLLFSAAAFGIVLAPWSVLYSDVRKALQSISLPLILISPIFYSAVDNSGSPLYWINIANPLASPLAVLNNVIGAEGGGIYLIPMLTWFLLSILILMLANKSLKKQIPILLERLGS